MSYVSVTETLLRQLATRPGAAQPRVDERTASGTLLTYDLSGEVQDIVLSVGLRALSSCPHLQGTSRASTGPVAPGRSCFWSCGVRTRPPTPCFLLTFAFHFLNVSLWRLLDPQN